MKLIKELLHGESIAVYDIGHEWFQVVPSFWVDVIWRSSRGYTYSKWTCIYFVSLSLPTTSWPSTSEATPKLTRRYCLTFDSAFCNIDISWPNIFSCKESVIKKRLNEQIVTNRYSFSTLFILAVYIISKLIFVLRYTRFRIFIFFIYLEKRYQLSKCVVEVCEWHEENNQELINNVWNTNEVSIYTLHREDEKKFAS